MRLEKITARGVDGLYRDPKSGMIYYRKYSKDLGGETMRSTKTKDLEKAKKVAWEIAKGRAPVKRKAAMRAIDYFDQWFERKRTLGAAKATLTSIAASRKYFEDWFSYLLVEELTAEWWESEYIPKTKAMARNPKRKFFNDRKWLIAFLRQMRDDGLISGVPNIRKVDVPVKAGKVFTQDEIQTLLNFAQNDDLYLAILMAATMGMRRGEIFGLSWDRINLKKGTITLLAEDTKTRRGRSFAISKDTFDLIKSRYNKDAVWLFPNKYFPSRPLHKDGFKTAWTNLKRKCGISGRFHDLRHTFLTNAFKSPEVNPAVLCYYAGLSMEVAERVYLHFTAEDTKAIGTLVSYSETSFGKSKK